jgi:hypothetical protein
MIDLQVLAIDTRKNLQSCVLACLSAGTVNS